MEQVLSENYMEISRKVGAKTVQLIGDLTAERCFLQPMGVWNKDALKQEYEILQRLAPGEKRLLAAVPIAEWNRELSPWAAPAVLDQTPFGDGAPELLHYFEQSLIPDLQQFVPTAAGRLYLCGYSLAGLFALWASCQSSSFAGIAAVSPSVWFPGWGDFSASHPTQSRAVYLSLGKREEKVRNAVLSSVGDALRRQKELLCGEGVFCTLEWNEGNHFAEPETRCAKGIRWLEQQCMTGLNPD